MNEEEFVSQVRKLGINVTNEKLQKLKVYCDFLLEYNSHTNLTAIKEKDQVYLKHFYDSLCLAQAVDFDKIHTLIDIGTGAGFPGLVIKIFYPHIKVTLLDSNNKKIKFLNQVVTLLSLEDVSLVNQRAEEYALKHLNEFDLCTARAVAYIDIIAELTTPFIKPAGEVVLLKGNNELEFSFLNEHKKDLNIQKIDLYSYSIIDSEKRYIIKIQKTKPTTKILSYSQIIKRNKKWTC